MKPYSPFASLNTETFPFPGIEGETITIQMLSHAQLQEAARESTLQSLELVARLGSARVIDEIAALKRDDPDAVKQAKADPMMQYDAPTLLKYGVKGWSLDEKCTRERVASLDRERAPIIAERILRFSDPDLFKDAAEVADGTKKI